MDLPFIHYLGPSAHLEPPCSPVLWQRIPFPCSCTGKAFFLFFSVREKMNYSREKKRGGRGEREEKEEGKKEEREKENPLINFYFNASLFSPFLTGFTWLLNRFLFCWNILYRLLLLLLSTLCLIYSSLVEDFTKEKYSEIRVTETYIFLHLLSAFCKIFTFIAKGLVQTLAFNSFETLMRIKCFLELEIMWRLILPWLWRKHFPE